MGATSAGFVSFADLNWFGVRAYDPGSRSFLSVDSLSSPVGAGWGANPYAFLGNDPVNLLDPWGLSPVSVQEMEEYQAANPAWVGAVKNWANEHAGLIKGAMIVAGIALTAAAVLATGPAAIIAFGALSGAALGGGFAINKDENGQVDWGKVGMSALIGGITGAIGGGVSQVLKVGGSAVASSFGSAGIRASNLLGNTTAGHILRYTSSAVGTAFSKGGAVASKFSPVVSATGREVISGAASGAFSNTANYLSSDIDHTFAGTVQSATNGALWGGGTAGIASKFKASQWVPGYAPVESLAETSAVRNAGVNLLSDSLAGGVNSAGNYLTAPQERYGDRSLPEAIRMFGNGAFQGGLKSVSKSSAPPVKEAGTNAIDYVTSPFRATAILNRFNQ